MIPRLGRFFPFIVVIIGAIDAAYLRYHHPWLSTGMAVLTVYVIYFMFKRHHAVAPKQALRNLFIPLIIMLTILIATWFVFS